MVGVAGPVNQLMQAFRSGGGVPMEAYDPSTWEGVTRFTSGWFENLLVPVWLPAMPEVQARLERGALVADVGRIRSTLDWRPQFEDLDTIVAHALAWERRLPGKREIASA